MSGDTSDHRYCPPTDSNLGNELLNPPPEPGSDVFLACCKLNSDVKDLCIPSNIDTVDSLLPPLDMYRQYVAANRPLLLRGAVSHWPAVDKWTHQYLSERVGDRPVTVTVTPNGYADAPNAGYFVMPHERVMPFAKFLDVIRNPDSEHGVWYVQKQNSNLTEEFSELLSDLDPAGQGKEMSWFSEVLGRQPDAVNFWMGDQRAVTSMHKDPYENIYCVISGYKDFLLLPPTDMPWVPHRAYNPAIYRDVSDTSEGNNVYSDSSQNIVTCNDKNMDICSNERRQANGSDKASLKLDGIRNSESETNVKGKTKIEVDKSESCESKTLNARPVMRFSPCLRCLIEQRKSTKTTPDCVAEKTLKHSICSTEYLESSGTSSASTENIASNGISLVSDNQTESSNIKSRIECRHFTIEPSNNATPLPWIAVDPLNPDLEEFPEYQRTNPIRVRVHAGDSLYLPSQWFHHVQQSHGCIAVNYWYDMDYHFNYAYSQMLRSLTWKESVETNESDED